MLYWILNMLNKTGFDKQPVFVLLKIPCSIFSGYYCMNRIIYQEIIFYKNTITRRYGQYTPVFIFMRYEYKWSIFACINNFPLRPVQENILRKRYAIWLFSLYYSAYFYLIHEKIDRKSCWNCIFLYHFTF